MNCLMAPSDRREVGNAITRVTPRASRFCSSGSKPGPPSRRITPSIHAARKGIGRSVVETRSGASPSLAGAERRIAPSHGANRDFVAAVLIEQDDAAVADGLRKRNGKPSHEKGLAGARFADQQCVSDITDMRFVVIRCARCGAEPDDRFAQ